MLELKSIAEIDLKLGVHHKMCYNISNKLEVANAKKSVERWRR